MRWPWQLDFSRIGPGTSVELLLAQWASNPGRIRVDSWGEVDVWVRGVCRADAPKGYEKRYHLFPDAKELHSDTIVRAARTVVAEYQEALRRHRALERMIDRELGDVG